MRRHSGVRRPQSSKPDTCAERCDVYDILIDRLHKRIADQAVFRLIRAYLDAGTLINGVVEKSRCGAPVG